MPQVGIIGGTGLYEMEGFAASRREKVATPFGDPSDEYVVGMLAGVEVAFLPRHGRGHTLLPSEIPFRANIYGFRALGCERILSVSAVGSMKEQIEPGQLVFPDQFIDRTKHRPQTFFGAGAVAHVAFADPVCPVVSAALLAAARAEGIPHHMGGTYLCIEGPQFSTRAESLLYRGFDVDVIGMTNLPEARLAREAELCYATIALATDYDCWHETEEPVTGASVMETLRRNVERAKRLLAAAVPAVAAASAVPAGPPHHCECREALGSALLSPIEAIPEPTRKKLWLFLEKYATRKT